MYIYIIYHIYIFLNIRLSILKGCTGIDPGDEGNALGGSYMVFHWQCDLAPRSGTLSIRQWFQPIPNHYGSNNSLCVRS